MTPAGTSDTRDAIANMLRSTPGGDEPTNVGDPNDLVTDVAMSDPHDAVTVTSDADESFVTVAEPLPGPDAAHAELLAGREASADVARPSVGASSAEAAAAVASPGADEKEPWLVEATSNGPSRGFFANRKRTLIAAVAAALLVIVVVAVVASRDTKPSTSASGDKPEKTAVATAEPPKDDTSAEPAMGSAETPTAVEIGSAEAQVGSAEAPVVEPVPNAGSADAAAAAGSAETAKPTAAEEPAPVKAVAKKPTKRVATKPAAKPAAKKPVAKTTKTATKTSKAAVQKPGPKKPAWDPNSLLPPKKK